MLLAKLYADQEEQSDLRHCIPESHNAVGRYKYTVEMLHDEIM